MLNSTDRLHQAAPPAPIPENLSTTGTSRDLAQHWVNLTTKGETQYNHFSILKYTEKELLEAFESGKKQLPPGDDPLMAYYLNASPFFLKQLKVYPPIEARILESSSEIGVFLKSNEFFRANAVLQVIGCLDASIKRDGQRCRKLLIDHLEIAWKTDPPLFLHLPVSFEESLKFIGEALKSNELETAKCISQALDLVLPSYFDLPAQGRAMGRDETLDEIYRVLVRRKNFYAAFKLLFLFKGSGWNPLERSTVLDLPEQLKFIGKSNQYTRLLPALRAVYANTRFAFVLEDMIRRVEKDPARASESLLICKDVGILSSVWKSDVAKGDDFLLEAAATMPEEALPFALAHVRKACTGQIGLVGAYLERLLRQEPPFVFSAVYDPILRRAITTELKSDPSLDQQLRSYPRVMQIFRPEEFLRSLLDRPAEFMDHLDKNLSYLTDHRIFHDLAAVLVKGPMDELLWSKCRTVVERLVTDDAFLEDVVVLFETLASTNSSCMEVVIPRIGKRLNADQKQRLAQAYASALENNPRILTALPSETWLLGQLRRDECVQEFTRVLCHLNTEKVALSAVAEAEWIAPRLLTLDESPLFATFEALVCRLPKRDLDATVWKPHLAGLLARNPTNGALFNKLFELASGSEKVALQRCRKLSLEEMRAQLTTFRATGVFQDPQPVSNPEVEIEASIREALAKPPVTEQDFREILSLFKKTTSLQWELWGQFIRALPNQCSNSLVESAWGIWEKKHPKTAFKPEEGIYWEEAFLGLLGKLANNSDVFVNFLTKQAVEYAVRLEKQSSEVLLRLCLEKGILSCWNNKSDKCGAIVQTLSTLISNKKLKERHESVAGLLKDHYQVYLHLLFVQQNNDKLYDIGNTWFLENIGKSPLGGHLLKGYSMRPYVPRLLADQIVLLNWIEKSWPVNCAEITWLETTRVFSSLCNFEVEKLNQEQRARYFILLNLIWGRLLAGLPGLIANDPNKLAELFLGITKVFLIRAINYIDDKKTKYKILSQAHFAFYSTISPYLPLLEVLKFQLDYCSYLFSLIPFDFPDEEDLLKTALEELNLCILQLQGNDENLLKVGVNIFREALPSILQIPDHEILPHIRILMDNLLAVPCIVEAKPEEKFSWVSLLTNMCAGFQRADDKWAPAVANLACQIFMNCTHPDKVKVLTGKHDKKLISSSCKVLASLFLTMPKPECLELSKWVNLIQGFSNPTMERIALHLFQEVETLPPIAAYVRLMALAMLIRYTKPSNAKGLQHLEEFCNTATGEYFLSIGAKNEPLLRLRLHSQWVSTLVSLTQKCREFERTPLLALIIRKIAMACNMTTIACALIKDDATYKLYSPYLFRALGDDLEVIKAVHNNLIPDEVEALKQFKMLLAGKIQSLAKTK